ncbi:MAG: hypothetical protein AAF982_03795, partial [Pseudomonadota bacterium]
MSARSTPEKAGWDSVAIRLFGSDDIEAYVGYWHDRSNVFLDQMGIDRSRLPSPRKMREQLALSLEVEEARSSITTIIHDGEAVGVHELTDMDEDNTTAVMHAHMWSSNARGRGIGRISYVSVHNRGGVVFVHVGQFVNTDGFAVVNNRRDRTAR